MTLGQEQENCPIGAPYWTIFTKGTRDLSFRNFLKQQSLRKQVNISIGPYKTCYP